MYIPSQFSESSVESMHGLMRARPFATLVIAAGGALDANHIPVLLAASQGPCGALQGHIPRANPLVQQIASGTEALAIFHGPDGYITPSWYATKRDTGKAVPTWNYSVVHAFGVLRVVDDPAWVLAQVSALTNEHEAQFSEPWKVSDAPVSYTEQLIKALVGIELVITRLVGKTKASQNQPDANRAGVIDGLLRTGNRDADELAEMVRTASRPNGTPKSRGGND